LEDSIKNLQTGDRFLFWYSGHGDQLEKGNPHTDVICAVNYKKSDVRSSVTADDFHGIFSAIPASALAYWCLDSCYSGDLERDAYRSGVPKQFRHDPSSSPPARRGDAKLMHAGFQAVSSELGNIAFISSCGTAQTSANDSFHGRFNGVFTHFFLQELRAGLQTPLDQLVAKVQKDLKDNRYVQVPELHGPDTITKHPFLGQLSAISQTGMSSTENLMPVQGNLSTAVEETMNVKCPKCDNQFEVPAKSDSFDSVVSAIFGSSPRTTIVGYLGAAAAAVVPLLQNGKVDYSSIAMAVTIALLGRLAKDAAVTGPGN
jgi:hypothetical protein